MNINYTAVTLAAVAQFVIGAVWYMPVFGNLWGKIHGFAKMSKAEQKEAQKQMMPMLVVQFIMTVLTTIILAKLIILVPDHSAYMLAAAAWAGFVVPTQVSAVLFGGTDSKWVMAKILVMSGGSAACLFAAAAILGAY